MRTVLSKGLKSSWRLILQSIGRTTKFRCFGEEIECIEEFIVSSLFICFLFCSLCVVSGWYSAILIQASRWHSILTAYYVESIFL